MDESQLQFHIKQKKIIQDCSYLSDLKHSVVNKQDDISFWSDSQRIKRNQQIIDLSFFEDQDVLQLPASQFTKQSQHQQYKKTLKNELTKQDMGILKPEDESLNLKICKSIEDSSYDQTNLGSHFRMSISKQNQSGGIENGWNSIKKEQLKQKQKELSLISSTKQSVMNIMLLTKIRKRLIHFFQKYTIYGRSQLLTTDIRKQINDVCDNELYKEGQNFYQKILAYIPWQNKMKVISKLPLLNNLSLHGLILKLLFTTLNCIFLYIFSLITVFQGNNQNVKVILSSIVPIWVLEIIIKLNTIPQKTTNNLKQRKEIFINYFKTKSFFDLVPLIMTMRISENKSFSLVFNILIFLKTYNVFIDLKEIQQRLCMIVKRYYIVQLVNLIMQLFTIGHIISCLWYLLSIVETNYFHEEYTWTNDLQSQELIWWKLYVWSLYWSLTLMTTGSNTATTISQGFFTSFIMLFTTITFGYFLNAIGIILSEFDEQDQTKRKDMSIINEYMRKRNISNYFSRNLQQQVNLDLKYYYKKNYQKIQDDNTQVLEKISVELQRSLLKEYNKQILNRIKFLSSNFSAKAIEDLSLQVKEEFYFPNQVILNEDESKDGSILYIISGQVQLFGQFFKEQNLQIPLKIAKKGDLVGEINFFTGLYQTPCIRSSDFTKVLKIQRSNFINIIKEYEQDYDTFCQIKDKIMLYQDLSDINTKCLVCQKQNHNTNECPLTSFDKEIALFKVIQLQQGQQKRVKMKRTKTNKNNTLINLSFHKIQIKDFLNQIRIINQKVSTIQRIDIILSSEEEEENDDIDEYNCDKTSLDSYDIYLKKAQDDINIQKGMFKNEPPSVALSSANNDHQSTKVQKYQKASSKLQQNSFTEFEDIPPLSPPENQKNIRKNNQFEYQMDSISSDSQKNNRKLNYELLKNNSKEIQQQSEADINSKKTYKLGQKKRNSRSSFYIQLSLTDEQQQLQKVVNDNSKKQMKSDLKIQQKEQSYLSSLQNHLLPNTSFEQQLHYLWDFDKLKDYKYYFASGNSKIQILRYNRFTKKKIKCSKKKVKKISIE